VNNFRDNCTSKPNIIQKDGRYPHHQSYNQNVSFKPYNYENKTIRKNWDNTTGSVQNQLDVELSKHNRPSGNNLHQRYFSFVVFNIVILIVKGITKNIIKEVGKLIFKFLLHTLHKYIVSYEHRIGSLWLHPLKYIFLKEKHT